MKIEPNYFGKDGFHWFVGVVEDRLDPVKLGRLRVRVLGAHTSDKTLIPTCELHWAYVYQPITWNQSMNGLGHSPTGPAEGTWVWGFFKDNESAQDPIVLGTIAGIPEEQPMPSIGFYDPSEPHHDLLNGPRKIRRRWYPNDGGGAQCTNETTASLYPRQTHPWGCIIGESDVNRLARGENTSDTIIGVRDRQRDNGRPGEFHAIPIAFVHPTPARSWVEPLSDYNAQYPYNHVYESESGHVMEIDDTPDNERLHIYHRSGTYIEVSGSLEGNFSMKVVGNRYEVTMEHSYSHYQNACNITVDGETNVYCRSDCNLQVDGNMNVHVQGDYTEKVKGNYYTDIKGNRLVRIGGTDELDIGSSRTTKIGSSESLDIGSSRTTNIGSSDTLSVISSYDVKVGATSTVSAAIIHMNADAAIELEAGAQFGVTAATIAGGAGGWTWECNVASGLGFVSAGGAPAPGSPQTPGSPSPPTAPVLPLFPAPLGMAEGNTDGAADPICECAPDPNPALNSDTYCGPIPTLPNPVPCPDGCAAPPP